MSIKWLLFALNTSPPDLKGISSALEDCEDINIIDDKTGKTVLQVAIESGNTEVVRLILNSNSERREKKADVNFVNKQFQPAIECADLCKASEQIIQLLIEKRVSITQEQVDFYLAKCIQNLSRSALSEKDFALLAHCVSRLCGVDIGALLNRVNEHNVDRYMVHLCQYSFAQRGDEELEGWHALEFLSIRVFSLFETLVKLRKEWVLLDENSGDKEQFQKFLMSEILLEIETIKLIQERDAIAYSDFTLEVQNKLYWCLAGTFLAKVKSNHDNSFCLASGYKGHTFYITFTCSDEKRKEFSIRYDNLGRGIRKFSGEDRHFISQEGQVQPLVKIVKESDVLNDYIQQLFRIKHEDIPGCEYRREERGSEKREELYRLYETEREKRLQQIYDDDNALDSVSRSQQIPGMPKQEADTCVATCHQAGLLVRTNRKFYDWVVAEEKRCIVQVGRNQGAQRAAEDNIWQLIDNEETILTLNAQFCPVDVDRVIKESLHHFLFFHVFKTNFPASHLELNERILLIINSPSDIVLLDKQKSFFKEFTSDKQQEKCLSKNNMLLLNWLCACLCMKLALKEENRLKKWGLLQEAYSYFCDPLFKEHTTFQCGDDEADEPECLLNEILYLKALTQFFIGKQKEAERTYKQCLDNIDRLLNHNRIITRVAAILNETVYPRLAQISDNVNTSLGFLNYNQQKYPEAALYFKRTGEKSFSDSKQQTAYSAEALFGLALVFNTQERCKDAREICEGINRQSSGDKTPSLIIWKSNQELLKQLNDIPQNQEEERILSVSSAVSSGKRKRREVHTSNSDTSRRLNH